MNLLFFIRLLLRHTVLLIVMPIVLAGMVIYLTKDQPKIYNSNTTVYTGIGTGSSIVSLETAKFDMFATRAAFDNLINIIKSRSTIEEVSISLLATHLMLDEAKSEIISKKKYDELMRIVPDDVKQLVVKNNFEKTLENFRAYKNKNHTNFIYELVNYTNPHYSSNKISSKIKVTRVQSSDLIEISYESSDPGICKNTLELLTDIFIGEYTKIKVNQSDAIVKYFEGQLSLSNAKLNKTENELLEFNRSNNIINYYEQTKHVSTEKEHFQMRHLEIKLENAAARSVLAVLENKMSVQQKKRIKNDQVFELRKELTQVNIDIALKTYEDQSDTIRESALVEEIAKLQVRSYDIQQELKGLIGEQYFLDNSIEGVPSHSILEDWLANVIELEASEAQLKVAEIRNAEFEQLFENYAPLGATMKRLERKINVDEREYLSLLHSLSLAKLKQQNIELNSNLKIVTQPLFPIVAQPSKRKFLVVIAFMIGLFIPAFAIILLEFVDSNIKSSQRAEDMIGLKVAAIFPKLSNSSKTIDLDFIKKRGLDVIARRLILNTEKSETKKKPDINIVFSSLDGEGKTTLLALLLEKLSTVGYKVLFLTHDEINTINGIDIRKYKINNSFHRIEKPEDLDADFEGIIFEDYDYVFVEIPGVLNHTYPINLFNNADNSFLVTRANRAWTKSDNYSLKDIIEFSKRNKPQILLNGVEMQEMENIIGDLPRKRSFLRRVIKNTIQLRFFSKDKISNSSYF